MHMNCCTRHHIMYLNFCVKDSIRFVVFQSTLKMEIIVLLFAMYVSYVCQLVVGVHFACHRVIFMHYVSKWLCLNDAL